MTSIRMEDAYDRISLAFATFFGVGYVPIAPGTAATLAAIPLALVLKASGSPLVYGAFLVGLLMLGVVAAERAERYLGKRDPSAVVIDEVVGFLVAVAFLELAWWNLLVAFILFRLLDILKPLGIRDAERLRKGTGIMMDDVIAGFVTNVALHLLNAFVL